MNNATTIVIVLCVYLAFNFCFGLWVSRRHAKIDRAKGKGFINNYFIGGRTMGGFVLAMTLIATFISSSSFVGGPGVASSRGLVWVFLSMIQVPTAVLILGVLGKKFAIISRKINAVTVTGYLKARYDSPAVVIISSIALVVFFMVQMVAQFIGGAVLFQTVTGMPFAAGLLLFSLVVILYTTIGGFKAVVITDTIQAVVMVVGAILIIATIFINVGGSEAMVEKLNTINPTWSSPTQGGKAPVPFVLSFWVLVGFGVLGLPQTAVRGMGFKNTKSVHDAIIYGTIVCGFLMLVMHVSGALIPAVMDTSGLKTTDYLIPEFVLRYMHPVIAGLFIAAPLSAIMSTVSSLLILASAAIIKDIYLNYIAKDVKATENNPAFEKKISRMSLLATFIIGIIVVLFTLKPPSIIVWINLFAFGGLECAFLCPILFGLYWKGANTTGAIVCPIVSVIAFIFMSIYPPKLGGFTPIVPSIILSIVVFVVASLLGKKSKPETLALFFSDKT
ncbi:sodium/panthothenate symporter [Spirochaetia bacterium]|nr:sodium/panthothenate symporter [Spirochaetia bacterium]